ncbi:MAG: CbiQ family ECF transporter T component [Candidatus Dormibacteria bacterium]
MNPRALLLWVGAVLLLSLGSEDPVYRLLTLVAALLLLVRWRRPGVRLTPIVWWIGAACTLGILFNFVLSHTGQDVIATLPDWLPAIGGQLTVEGAAYGVDVALGLGACLLAAAALAAVIDSQELVDALPRQLQRTGAALGASLTLIPRLRQSFMAVREAQSMRGRRPRGPRSWRAVAVPSVLSAIEGSVLLAEAMEARGFGSGRRTPAWNWGWRKRDVLVAATSGMSLGLFSLALILGRVGGWQPYPQLQLPGIDWVPAAACLLLLVPGLIA